MQQNQELYTDEFTTDYRKLKTNLNWVSIDRRLPLRNTKKNLFRYKLLGYFHATQCSSKLQEIFQIYPLESEIEKI